MSHLSFLPVFLFIFQFTGLLAVPIASEAPLDRTIRALVPPEEDGEVVPWAARRMLTWEDFQCAPTRGTEAVASTSTSLGISYQMKEGQLTYRITCNFSKKKSWGLMKTDYILAHEQAHFDITELYARKLHNALAEYRLNPRTFKSDINRIYDRIVSGKESMQAAYDRETDHSRNRRVQAEWLIRIQMMLDETEPFAVYP